MKNRGDEPVIHRKRNEKKIFKCKAGTWPETSTVTGYSKGSTASLPPMILSQKPLRRCLVHTDNEPPVRGHSYYYRKKRMGSMPAQGHTVLAQVQWKGVRNHEQVQEF